MGGRNKKNAKSRLLIGGPSELSERTELPPSAPQLRAPHTCDVAPTPALGVSLPSPPSTPSEGAEGAEGAEGSDSRPLRALLEPSRHLRALLEPPLAVPEVASLS